MMTRTTALLASTAIQLALVALPGVALAQASPTPPENYTLDARGVDLVEGTFVYQADEVAIGPQEGGLVHSRVYVGHGWRDTLSGTIAVDGSISAPATASRSADGRPPCAVRSRTSPTSTISASSAVEASVSAMAVAPL